MWKKCGKNVYRILQHGKCGKNAYAEKQKKCRNQCGKNASPLGAWDTHAEKMRTGPATSTCACRTNAYRSGDIDLRMRKNSVPVRRHRPAHAEKLRTGPATSTCACGKIAYRMLPRGRCSEALIPDPLDRDLASSGAAPRPAEPAATPEAQRGPARSRPLRKFLLTLHCRGSAPWGQRWWSGRHPMDRSTRGGAGSENFGQSQYAHWGGFQMGR